MELEQHETNLRIRRLWSRDNKPRLTHWEEEAVEERGAPPPETSLLGPGKEAKEERHVGSNGPWTLEGVRRRGSAVNKK